MFEMLKATYKNDSMGKTQVFEYFSRFKSRETSIDGRPRIKRPEPTKMPKKFAKSSWKIDGRLSKKAWRYLK